MKQGKRRTDFNFDEHVHRVEEYKCGNKTIRIDHFQVEYNNMFYIQFVNTDRFLTVSGDFGNWVFCRPFIPSPDGFVSDNYWLEKLKIGSQQSFERLDFDAIEEDIMEKLNGGLEDYGYEGDELEQAKEWYNNLLGYLGDEIGYKYHAFRDYAKPLFIDYDNIPLYKEMPERLNIIFDAFDEICNRLKNDMLNNK